MEKADYPALLPPGCHKCDLARVFELSVRPFLPDARRADLWDRFKWLVGRLHGIGLTGVRTWIGGSFLTTRTNPGDFDVLVLLPPQLVDGMSDEQYAELQEIRASREVILNMYGVDLYFAPPDDANLTYWNEKFGTAHDNITPKGYFEVAL